MSSKKSFFLRERCWYIVWHAKAELPELSEGSTAAIGRSDIRWDLGFWILDFLMSERITAAISGFETCACGRREKGSPGNGVYHRSLSEGDQRRQTVHLTNQMQRGGMRDETLCHSCKGSRVEFSSDSVRCSPQSSVPVKRAPARGAHSVGQCAPLDTFPVGFIQRRDREMGEKRSVARMREDVLT